MLVAPRRRPTGAASRRTRRQVGSMTRSSRWMTSWTMPSGSSLVLQPGDLAQLRRLDEHHALGEGGAVGTGDLDRVAVDEATLDSDDAGGEQAGLALDERSASAVVDASPSRRRVPAKAIHSLRAPSRRRRASKRVPTVSPATAPASTSGRAGVGDHRRHTRPRRDARRLQLARHAAAPPAAAAAAGANREQRVVGPNGVDELGRRDRVAGRRCTGRRGR